MRIPAWLFFSFCAITSLTFLKLGFNALDRTDLSSTVSPTAIFLLKNAFALSVCLSSHYAFHFRPHLKVIEDRYFKWAFLALIPLVFFGDYVKGKWYFLYCAFIKFNCLVELGRAAVMTGDDIALEIDFIVKVSMYFIEDDRKFFPTWVMVIAIYAAAIWANFVDDKMHLRVDLETSPFISKMTKPGQWESRKEQHDRMLCRIFLVRDNSWILKKMIYRNRRLIRFAAGVSGSILFQHFFPLTTFDRVLAFLYLAVAWLSNLVLLQRPSGDLGILDFLLGNVVVGCTVNQFGLRGTTWLAFGLAVLLYGLRLELERMSLVNRGENESQVLVFGQVDDHMRLSIPN